MKFLRLSDPLLSVLFEDDDIVAIDKPYGFNAHTNDSKAEHADFIQDGLIEIYEKNFGRKLHVIHRLDQTTTGVMIFGKSVESAKKYAEFFFNRQVKKTYWFLTKHNSSAESFLIDDAIVHKGRELDAKTQLTLLRKSGPFELWQANPFTGRNHQIRIHALSAGIPILGDRTYEGAPFPFICLHNHRIEFPNGLVIVSQAPAYFESTELLARQDLATAVFETDRRRRLFGSADRSQSFRLVHPAADGPGFSLDQLGEHLLLNWLKSAWTSAQLDLFQTYANLVGRTVFARDLSEKSKSPADVPVVAISPAGVAAVTDASTWRAREGRVNYELRGDLGSSAGLSLNQRLQRNWVLQNADGKSVLSLFAGTGSFAISAAVGGATRVVGVEANKRALAAARRNMELNELAPESITFFCRDSITFLDQSRGKAQQYDLVLCEAPSFLKREKKIFRIKTDLEELLKTCLLSVKSGGHLLFSTTFDDFFVQDIRQAIVRAQGALKIPRIEINHVLASMDFELPDEKAALKSFLIRVG